MQDYSVRINAFLFFYFFIYTNYIAHYNQNEIRSFVQFGYYTIEITMQKKKKKSTGKCYYRIHFCWLQILIHIK